jgi:hemolysin activation/secretion protein
VPSVTAAQLKTRVGSVKLDVVGQTSKSAMRALGVAIDKGQIDSGSPAWAQRVQDVLRAEGYPFARVGLAPGGNGRLLVAFGELDGPPRFQIPPQLDAQRLQSMYLKALCPKRPAGAGCIVRSHDLERATALVSLQPEVKDLNLEVDPEATDPNGRIGLTVKVHGHEKPVQVAATADDFGAPGLGRMNAGLTVSAANLIPGGSLSAQLSSTNKREVTGGASWTQGLGDDGVAMTAQASRTTYSESIPAAGTINGTATSASLGLSYPVAMNFDRLLKVSGDVGLVDSRSSLTAVGTLQKRQIPYFDLTLSGGSGLRALGKGRNYTQGSVSLRVGVPKDSAQGATAQDSAGPQELGSFSRISAQYVWHHGLGLSPWSAGVVLRGQLATRNLDPSQQMAFGGPTGVRGYRADEGGLDDGAIASLSLERRIDLARGVEVSPQAFIDYAVGNTHHQTWKGWNAGSPGLANRRQLGSLGVGLDASAGKLSASLSVARQLPGSDVSLAAPSSKTQIWANAQLMF